MSTQPIEAGSPPQFELVAVQMKAILQRLRKQAPTETNAPEFSRLETLVEKLRTSPDSLVVVGSRLEPSEAVKDASRTINVAQLDLKDPKADENDPLFSVRANIPTHVIVSKDVISAQLTAEKPEKLALARAFKDKASRQGGLAIPFVDVSLNHRIKRSDGKEQSVDLARARLLLRPGTTTVDARGKIGNYNDWIAYNPEGVSPGMSSIEIFVRAQQEVFQVVRRNQ